MSGTILPLPQYAFMEWYSVKRSTDITFLFMHLMKFNISELHREFSANLYFKTHWFVVILPMHKYCLRLRMVHLWNCAYFLCSCFNWNIVLYRMSYGLDERGFGSRRGLGIFLFNTASRTASYPMGTRVSFPGGKTAGTWSWPLTCI